MTPHSCLNLQNIKFFWELNFWITFDYSIYFFLHKCIFIFFDLLESSYCLYKCISDLLTYIRAKISVPTYELQISFSLICFHFIIHCCGKILHFFFYFFLFLIGSREGGKEGRREGEKHRLVSSCMYPNWAPNRQPRHVPWRGIEPATCWSAGQHPTNWATPTRAVVFLIISILLQIFFYFNYQEIISLPQPV